MIAFTIEESGGVYKSAQQGSDMAFPSPSQLVPRSTPRATSPWRAVLPRKEQFQQKWLECLRIYFEGTVELSDIKQRKTSTTVSMSTTRHQQANHLCRMVFLDNYYRYVQIYSWGRFFWNYRRVVRFLYGVFDQQDSATTPQVVTISQVSFNEASSLWLGNLFRRQCVDHGLGHWNR
jgi:hypothetical protein